MMVIAVFCLNVAQPGYGFQSPVGTAPNHHNASTSGAATGSEGKTHGVVDSSGSDRDASRV